MRVAFLGNHTVGVRTLDAIAAEHEVVAVVAHPPDAEDGVRYASVYDHAAARSWPVRRLAGRDAALVPYLADARPDVLVVADYRYLLADAVLEVAPHGAVNLHPSLLPRYRGRAPINWAILSGETRLGLTAHRIDGGLDTGDVLAQRSFELGPDEDVGDALERLYPLYEEVVREVLAGVRDGTLRPSPQRHEEATVFPTRRPEDGLIDWSLPATRIRDLVRAVAHPYPGAFTSLAGQRVTVWRAALVGPSAGPGPQARPGSVLGGEVPAVVCGEGSLLLRELEWQGPPAELRAGQVLGT